MARQITPRQRSYILGMARRRKLGLELALQIAKAQKGDLATVEASQVIAALNAAPRMRRRKKPKRSI